jgi:hypothetical protein
MISVAVERIINRDYLKLKILRLNGRLIVLQLMKKLTLVLAMILLCGIIFIACHKSKPPSPSQFSNDWTGLFLSVTKSFGEQTYYLGSDDEWSYFKSWGDSPEYRKVKTSSLNLTNTFPYLQGKSYKLKLTDFKGSTNANGIVGYGP